MNASYVAWIIFRRDSKCLSEYVDLFLIRNNAVYLLRKIKIYEMFADKPIINLSEPLTKAAARIGNTAKLICKASGAPTVSFSWSKNDTILPKNSDEKYKMETKSSNYIHYTSILSIRNVDIKDYDVYGCIARNALGDAKTMVKLQPISEPDPPIALTAVNATHDSITLSWTPGFDGGKLFSNEFRIIEVFGIATKLTIFII